MARSERGANQDFETLMSDLNQHGTRTADDMARQLGRSGEGRSRVSGAGLATLVSIIALVFSGFSFYETVLKQAELRVYQPPLIYMYRQGFRDVFAIPITISNDGARRGTVLSFDLKVTNLETNAAMSFQNLHFGESPAGSTELFAPITVAGGSSSTKVVLFHALKPGSFVETTGGVRLPLRLELTLNVDGSGAWNGAQAPPPIIFDMTATYIASLKDMEAGRPTQLYDSKWTAGVPAPGNREQ